MRRPALFVVAAALTAVLVWVSTASADVTATEGTSFSGVVTTISAQCPAGAIQSVTVTWGDGASSAGTVTRNQNTYSVSGTHTYDRYGSYAGSVSLDFLCNGVPITQTGQFTAQVADAALSASGVVVNAIADEQFTGPVAHLLDANPSGVAADDSATITWGDGAASAGTVVAAAAGGFDIVGSHTYALPGADTVSVAVQSSGGSTATATATATVAAPAPPVVRASFAALGAPAPGRVLLDASASAPPGTTAAYYDWQLASAPGQDIVCPGDEPRLELEARAATSTTLTLAAVDAGTGTQTSTSETLSIPAPQAVEAHGATLPQRGLAIDGVCSSVTSPVVPPLSSTHLAVSARPQVSSVGGGPPPGCDQDLVFGAADVRGCFSPIPDPNQLPGGITLLLANLLCGAHDQDFCLETGTIAKASGLAQLAAIPAQKISTLPTTMGRLGLSSYYSYSAIRLDGVDIVPQSGSPILIIPAAKAIVAPEIRVFLGGHPIVPKAIPLALYVPAAGGHLGTLTLPHALPLIGSLPFSGSISIDLARAHSQLSNGDTCEYACAALTVSAQLPGVLSDGDGNGLSAAGVVTADAVNGIQLDSLEVRVPSAQLAGIGVSDVDIRYSHATDSLHAQATVDLFDAAGDISGSIDFTHGSFSAASVAWDAGDGPGIDLGGPLNIYLTHLGGAIALDPTTINANGTITGGPQTLGCALFGMTGSITMQFDPFALDANATGQLLCQNVADEYFHLDSSGSILIGGDVDIPLLFFEFKGGLAIAGDTARGHFQADANMSACINIDGTHCLGAEVVVSDRGAGLCADLGFTHAGGGIQWPDNVLVFFDSCDIGKFRSLGFTTALGTRPRTFTIPKGESVSVIGVTGAAAAPRVTLHGPRGETIHTPASGYEKTAHRLIVADDAHTRETYFLLDHATAGRWTITTDAGSPPVVAIQQAASLPAPDVHTRLHMRHNGRVTLDYHLHPQAGQRVTFVERAGRDQARTIGTAHGAVGRLTFTPSPTFGLRRTIVAEVVQDGHPREDDTVARYTAATPKPLPAPRGLRATRGATTLALRWHRIGGAHGYAVTVRLSDHTRRFVQVTGTRANLASLPPAYGAKVSVSALRAGGLARVGRAARATIAPHRLRRQITVAPL